MNNKTFLSTLVLCFLATTVHAAKVDKVIEQTFKTYSKMKTYSSTGEITMEVEKPDQPVRTFKTQASLRLSRPNYYIDWIQNLDSDRRSAGVLWRTEDTPYIYLSSPNVYATFDSDERAIVSAMEVSHSATNIIPTMFYDESFKGFRVLETIENPEIVSTEDFNGETCYIIEGKTKLSENSKFWISKKRKVVLQHQYVVDYSGMGDYAGTISDEDIAERLRKIGGPVTAERIARIKNSMKDMKNRTGKTTFTETYKDIEINKGIEESIFDFQIPNTAQLNKDIFVQ